MPIAKSRLPWGSLLRAATARNYPTRVTISLAVLTAFHLGCGTYTVPLRGWVEVRSEHFSVTSSAGEKETQGVVRWLETFRRLVEKTTNADTAPRLPTRFFLFRSSFDYEQFAPRLTDGVFVRRLDGNFAVARDARYSTITHEYSHFLVSNSSGFVYPLWYHEGLAMIMGSVERGSYGGSRGLDVGTRPSDAAYLRNLPWVPVSRVLSPNDGRQWTLPQLQMFYFESWALAHRLMLGPYRRSDYALRLARYMEQVAGGAEAVAAFGGAFGENMEDFDQRLRRYAWGPLTTYRIPIEALGEVDVPVLTALPRKVAARQLGQFAGAVSKWAVARAYFEAALEFDRSDVIALAGLARATRFDPDGSDPLVLLDEALAIDPTSATVQIELGLYWQARAEAADSPERERMLEQAREHLDRAREAEPYAPRAHARFGATFLVEGQDPVRGLEGLRLAHEMTPANEEVRLLLARACLGAGRADQARSLIEPLIASHDPTTSGVAREYLALIAASRTPGGERDVEPAR